MASTKPALWVPKNQSEGPVTFHKTDSDDSDSYDDAEEYYPALAEEYDLISIVSQPAPNWGKNKGESFAEILKRNLDADANTSFDAPQITHKHILTKPRNVKVQEPPQQLDMDSIAFVGHSYFNEKGAGYIARKNSLRLRPDEAKRMDMINVKKEKQRNGESTKKQKKLRVVKKVKE